MWSLARSDPRLGPCDVNAHDIVQVRARADNRRVKSLVPAGLRSTFFTTHDDG